jgi:LPXTG-motif cell wall-anchored protein
MFLGPNGSGKSTLMRILTGRLQASSGKLELGYNIKIGYYDQENRGLSESKTVFSELHDEYPEMRDVEIRSTLALFLFGAEDMDKPVSVLSGGERARLTLAKLILKKVNLLIMDEPTNHLDIGSAEALENALLAFDGTIIAVSHDRYFINTIATRIIELDKNNERGMVDYSLEDYDDAYTEYIRIREASREAARVKAEAEAAAKRSAETSSKQDYEQRKRESAERRAAEKRLAEAKKKIEKLEAELEALDEELFGEAMTTFTWSGLDDGDYKLVETTVPAGYNKMADVLFSISAAHEENSADPQLTLLEGGAMGAGVIETGIIEKDIVNHTGTILPEAGAQGTFLLIFGGAVLAVIACVFMITRKKMSVYED